MLKFVKIMTGTNVLKLKDGDKPETFYNATPEAYGYAKSNFVPGDDVEITVNDAKVVTKIGKAGSGAGQAAPQQAPAPGTTSTQESPKQDPPVQQKTNTGYRQDLSPEVARSIRRQSVMASTCQAMVALQGSLDPNVFADYTVTLFNRLLSEVEK